MTKITLPTTDARIEQGVWAGLEAAAIEADMYRAGFPPGAMKTVSEIIGRSIRLLAADPAVVEHIARGRWK